MNEKAIQHSIQRCNLRQVDFENEAIFASDSMTFHNLRNRLRQRSDFRQTPGKRPNPDKGGDCMSERLRIYLEPVAGDQAALFQTKYTLFDGWVGHPNLPTQLRDRHPGIFLQQAHYFDIFAICGYYFIIHQLITNSP